MKNSFILTISIVTSSLIVSGCSSHSQESIVHTTQPATPSSESDFEEIIVNSSYGIFDRETNIYTEEIPYWEAKYGDCKSKISFQITVSEDDSNHSGLFMDDIQYLSLDIISGWDSVSFKEISSIEYFDNNQVAEVYWSYEGTVDNQLLTHEHNSTISLY